MALEALCAPGHTSTEAGPRRPAAFASSVTEVLDQCTSTWGVVALDTGMCGRYDPPHSDLGYRPQMAQSPSLREKAILNEVRRRGAVSIQTLADRLGVSLMTIHRDINKLVGDGRVEKARGEVRLPRRSAEAEDGCAMCGKDVPARTIYVVTLASGEQKRACCAHCGLMVQMMTKDVWQAMATDFLYGHIISASQAYYVIGSAVNVCCVPSVMSFSSLEDARRFSKGFGGHALSFADALTQLESMGQSPAAHTRHRAGR